MCFEAKNIEFFTILLISAYFSLGYNSFINNSFYKRSYKI